MHNEYIEKLWSNLKKTKFFKRNGEIELLDSEAAMQELMEYIYSFKKNGNQVFFIGNGGSAAISSHMTADFMKNGGMKTYSLYDSSVTTCMGNDYGYEYVFSKPLEFLGQENDLLIVISSSGNSANIVKALETAKVRKMKVVTFTGFGRDNKSIGMGDYSVYVPISHYGIVESIHNLLLQEIVDTILERDGVTL